MNYTIRKTAEITGIPVDALRYYDKLGIISPTRAENGYRYYTDMDIEALRYVVVMKYSHFSLAEIKTVMSMFDKEPSENCRRLCQEIFQVRLGILRDTVTNYQGIIHALEQILPLLDDLSAFLENEERVDGYIQKIFEDIRQNGRFTLEAKDGEI